MEIRFDNLASGQELRVAFDSGLHVSCAIDPPPGPVALVDVLPDIFSLPSTLLAQAQQAHRELGRPVTCAKGCNYCCHHLVAVSTHEALLLAHIVGLLQGEDQKRILAAFDSTRGLLEREGLLAEMIDCHANAFYDFERVVAVQRRYWELKIPCPFLHDGACSIYPFRPLLCRQYLVSSPPINCAGSFKADHLVKRIPLSYDVASAAASFDGLSALETRAVPLPAVLTVNGLLESFPRPKATAKALITAFLHHLQENFTRHVVLPPQGGA
jgi:Fe-S-cluster containining protein